MPDQSNQGRKGTILFFVCVEAHYPHADARECLRKMPTFERPPLKSRGASGSYERASAIDAGVGVVSMLDFAISIHPTERLLRIVRNGYSIPEIFI
jgi:hypothetical protein